MGDEFGAEIGADFGNDFDDEFCPEFNAEISTEFGTDLSTAFGALSIEPKNIIDVYTKERGWLVKGCSIRNARKQLARVLWISGAFFCFGSPSWIAESLLFSELLTTASRIQCSTPCLE